MKKTSCLLLTGLISITPLIMQAELINLSTPQTSLVLDATKSQPLRILHYGDILNEKDIEGFKTSTYRSFSD